MEEWGNIQVKIKAILGDAKPFPQGGSWRLTIPKKVVKEHKLENKMKRSIFRISSSIQTKGCSLFPSIK